nr:ABC transporter ATP-binding protein [uncultured Dysosmobacter sp.]
MLRIDNLCAGYGDLQVLFDVNLHVNEGEIVSLVGSNGAGKTTLLRLISGLEKIKSGTITYRGEDLSKYKPYQRASLGISHIPQGRGILRKLSVKENLALGGLNKNAANVNEKIEEAYVRFPILKERQNQVAGSLSGGEQQMLAISRALIMNPKIIIMDEPSMGLAPIVVKEVFNIIKNLADSGLSILLIEQNLVQALGVAHRGYVIETGRIVMEGGGKELLARKDIQTAYLGI